MIQVHVYTCMPLCEYLKRDLDKNKFVTLIIYTIFFVLGH
jgi:hypothetical protein